MRSVLNNKLDVESATMLAKIGTEKRIMLSGMKQDQTEASFYNQGLKPADAILIASDLSFMAVLTKLDLSSNSTLGDEGAIALCEALKSNTTLETLDLVKNDIGVAGAQSLAGMLQVNRALKYVDSECNKIPDEAKQQLRAAVAGKSITLKL